MASIAERWKIDAILLLLKQVGLNELNIPGRKDPTSKTSLCMRAMGYTPSDVLSVLHSLRAENYSEGPKSDDKGRPRDLWVFGKCVEDKLLYIKFAVYCEGEVVIGVCVSFHEPEYEMRFPYKEVR